MDKDQNSKGILTRKWEVTEFIGNSTSPKTIKRLRDNTEFSIGDYVTNGTIMKGNIESFDYSFRSDEVYVKTDWSGVGMNLDSLSHTFKLPCEHQIGSAVSLVFGSSTLFNCQILKVHFSNDKVLYDVEVSERTVGITDPNDWSTRLYNVEEQFVFARGKEPKNSIDYKKRRLELFKQQKDLLQKQLINMKGQRIAVLQETIKLKDELLNESVKKACSGKIQ